MKINPLYKAMLDAGIESFSKDLKNSFSDMLPELKEVKEKYQKTKQTVDREAIAKELHSYIDKLKDSNKGDTLLTIATLLRNFVKEVDEQEVVKVTPSGEVLIDEVNIGGVQYDEYSIPYYSIVDNNYVIKFDRLVDKPFVDKMVSKPNVLISIWTNSNLTSTTILLRVMNNPTGYSVEEDKHFITLSIPINPATDFSKNMK